MISMPNLIRRLRPWCSHLSAICDFTCHQKSPVPPDTRAPRGPRQGRHEALSGGKRQGHHEALPGGKRQGRHEAPGAEAGHWCSLAHLPFGFMAALFFFFFSLPLVLTLPLRACQRREDALLPGFDSAALLCKACEGFVAPAVDADPPPLRFPLRHGAAALAGDVAVAAARTGAHL